MYEEVYTKLEDFITDLFIEFETENNIENPDSPIAETVEMDIAARKLAKKIADLMNAEKELGSWGR